MAQEKIVILGTGGTIAGQAQSSTQGVGYKAGQLSVAGLLAAVPDLSQLAAGRTGAVLDALQIAQIDSKDMDWPVWRSLLQAVKAGLEDTATRALVITHGTDTLEETAWLLQAVGSLVQPLFQRGQLMANLKISKAQQEEALLQFQQTLLDAGAEVNNALSQWQTTRQKTVLDREQVEHLKDALRDTELLMEHGTTNYLEVLTARQSLLAARLSLVSDRNAEIKSVITLYHALGGGNN